MKYVQIKKRDNIQGSVTVPGSKSYSNRYLLLAGLSSTPVSLSNMLIADDTEAMIGVLQALGATLEKTGDAITISKGITTDTQSEYVLDAHMSGTTARFILPILCGLPGSFVLTGEKRLRERPIKDLCDCLRSVGADITFEGETGFLPVRVRGRSSFAERAEVRGDISSQFLSGMLMAMPVLGVKEVSVTGGLVSSSYVDLTRKAMADFGITLSAKENSFFSEGVAQYKASQVLVESDFSSASYFASLATLSASTLSLPNISEKSLQGDRLILDVLREMGSAVSEDKKGISITGNGVCAVTVDVTLFPDQAQTLAVLGAFAVGTTHLSGVRSLRVKETERVQALQTELLKIGIKTESTEDTLTIFGGNPHTATIDTYNDHRMAMSFALAGVALSEGVTISAPDVVSKTYPHFWKDLASLGVEVTFFEK